MSRGEGLIAAMMGGQIRRFTAGEVLSPADGLDGCVHLLRVGWLRRVRTLPDGRSQTMLIFLPGDIVGVKSLVFARSPDEIIALSDAETLVLSPTALRTLMVAEPDAGLRLMWQLAEDERRLQDLALALGQGSAEERVSLAVLDLVARLRGLQMIGPSALAFRLPMTQHQLAEHCGLTAIHINRVLRRLRLDDVLEMRRGTISVVNEAALEARALPLQWPDLKEQAAE